MQKKESDSNETDKKPGELTDPSAAPIQLGLQTPPENIGADDFQTSFGEPLENTLNLDTWERGEDLVGVFERLDHEISQALDQEDTIRKQVRKVVFKEITGRRDAPKGAGVFQASIGDLKTAQTNVLFNGAVEACDGTCVVHETLPLSIAQIGVCVHSRS